MISLSELVERARGPNFAAPNPFGPTLVAKSRRDQVFSARDDMAI
jgi:hypothetical protein